MASKRNRRAPQETKAALKQLKRKGLYHGDLRKAPTRYAEKLVDEFADVLAGRAQVVAVPKRGIGKREASARARAIAEQFAGNIRAKENRLIVKVARPEEKAVYRPKAKEVVTRYTRPTGELITHKYVAPEAGRLPPLGEGESYALPFNRGKKGIEYVMRATEEDIMALANEYEKKIENPYRGATGFIQIAYPGKERRPTRHKAAAAGSNVVQLDTWRRK